MTIRHNQASVMLTESHNHTLCPASAYWCARTPGTVDCVLFLQTVRQLDACSLHAQTAAGVNIA